MPFLSLRTSEFYPLTLTMPIECMLFGMSSLENRWKNSIINNDIPANRWIEPTVLPDDLLIETIKSLGVNQILKKDEFIIAAHLDEHLHVQMKNTSSGIILEKLDVIPFGQSFESVSSLQYMIDNNKDQIIRDWQNNPDSLNWKKIPTCKNSYSKQNLSLANVTIDDQQGPVIIHDDVVVLPGAKIMGPVILMPGTVVKMGAELYPGSTFGKNTTVNGEIKNSIIHEYSAKGHAGYLGDSILGRWNNFGAGTIVSNVSNTFSKAHIIDWNTHEEIIYGTIKRGLITGDFVKLGILSKVYRGTSIGSFTSIATNNVIKGNISEFTWWTENHKIQYEVNQLRKHCRRQMELYNQSWTDDWESAMTQLIAATQNYKMQDK